jgi:hypothetical protein
MSERRPRSVFATTAGKVGAAISAVVATLAALVGVLRYADEKIDPPVPVRIAEIKGVELRDVAQPLRDYLAEVRPTDGRRYTRDELRRPGCSFLLRLSAEGPEGMHVRLRWTLHDADGRRVPGAAYAQVSADFTTSASRQTRRWPVWVPPPPRDGRYVVRFTLEDDERRLIDQLQSRPFRYRSPRA